MEIYLVNYLVITIACFLYYSKKISLNVCVFVCCFSLWLIVGLRHVSLGLVDTQKVYMHHFYLILNRGLDAVYSEKDTLFYYVTYLFTKTFGNKPVLYLLLMSFPYIFSVGNLIKKYSKNIFLSFIIFSSLHYYEISFTLMRQVTAMSIVLFSVKYLKEKNLLKFVSLVVFSSFFHQISLVFLVAYPFMHLNSKNRIRFIVGGIILFFVVSLIFPSLIRQIAYYLFEENSRFSHYTVVGYSRNKNLVFFTICLFLSFIGLFYIRNNNLKSDEELKNDQILLSLSLLSTMFSPATVIITEFSRVSYFFGIYNICMVPNAISYEKNKNTRFVINLVLVIVFVMYFITRLGPDVNIIPYKFYWQ